MELKDIILKKGDIVYFEPQGKYLTCAIFEGNKECNTEYYCEQLAIDDWYPKITKIERPVKYETIYEVPKQILDKKEKEYLENFLRPFKNKVKHIYKNTDIGQKKEWLCFYIGHIWYDLPMFDKNTMYKGMKLNKYYTLKKLGLFEE